MIEKINENEYIVSGNNIADRKFIVSKPTGNYRVETFKRRPSCDGAYFGRIISEKGNLRYFKTKDEVIAFIYRQDFSN